jgi:cobalamin biosynthesis Mg chelatase CobN
MLTNDISIQVEYEELGSLIKKFADVEMDDEFKENLERMFIDAADRLHLAHQLNEMLELD